MDYLLDLLQGLGIAAAIGIRPFLPTLLVGALAAGNVGIDFDGTDFSFLEKTPFLLAVVVAVAVFNIVDRRRGADTSVPGPVTTILLVCSLVLGALLASGVDRRRQLDLVAGRPDRRGGGLARLHGRPLALRPGERPPGHRDRRRRCRSTPKAPRCSAPASRSSSRRWRSSSSSRSRGCSSAAAAVRARSTPGSASSDEEARPRGRRRDEARDARAGRRDRPRARAAVADGARALRRRVRRGLPVRHAGLRGLDRHRHRARTSTRSPR